MRTYEEAVALAAAGVTEVASHTNGRTKRVAFRFDGEGVAVRMFQTDIVRFRPEDIVVNMGGYVTPSTFDGIAAALGIQRAFVGTRKGVPHLFATALDPKRDNVFSYDRQAVQA